jgi:hypothetical protein
MKQDDVDSVSTELSLSPCAEDFWFEKQLGCGKNGQVWLVNSKANSNDKFALKVVDRGTIAVQHMAAEKRVLEIIGDDTSFFVNFAFAFQTDE